MGRTTQMIFAHGSFAVLLFTLMLTCVLPAYASDADSVKKESQSAQGYPLGYHMFPEYWVDLIGRPCPVTSEDYKVVLDSETLAPDRLTIDTSNVYAQSKEARMIEVFGANYRLIDSATYHTPEQGNRYISDLMQTYRKTMHYHHLRMFENISGWFKTYEWVLADGTIVRAHLKANSKEGKYRGFLLHVSLPKSSTGKAKIRNIGEKMMVARDDEVHAEWDVSANWLTIKCRQ